jgi:hypothetical protein
MLDLLLSGSRWFQLALPCALVATAQSLRPKTPVVGVLERASTACNRFYGTVMAVMATGHMVAVTLSHHQQSLTAGASLPFLYAVGLVLFVPATWLAVIAGRLDDQIDERRRRSALVLNALLAAILVASVTSAPLAVPAILNVVLLRRPSRRAMRWCLTATAAAYLAMFTASFYFRDF